MADEQELRPAEPSEIAETLACFVIPLRSTHPTAGRRHGRVAPNRLVEHLRLSGYVLFKPRATL